MFITVYLSLKFTGRAMLAATAKNKKAKSKTRQATILYTKNMHFI